MAQRTDIISQDVAKTLDGLFQERVRRTPSAIAYRNFDEVTGTCSHATILTQPWTVENGLLTPTMKLKRMKVVEAHKPEFESLYAGH